MLAGRIGDTLVAAPAKTPLTAWIDRAQTISVWKFRAGFNRGAGWQCRLLLAHALSAASGPAWAISIVGSGNDRGFLVLPGRVWDREDDR